MLKKKKDFSFVWLLYDMYFLSCFSCFVLKGFEFGVEHYVQKTSALTAILNILIFLWVLNHVDMQEFACVTPYI